MRVLHRWLLCLTILSLSLPVLAQGVNPETVVARGASYFIFAQPGEPTVEVFVLGDSYSGIYVVGANTSLLDLIALTGAGSTVVDDSEFIRNATLRLMREQGGSRVVVYERDFDRFLTEPDSYPALQDGDVFTVESRQRRRFGLRVLLEYASGISSVVLLAIRLSAGR